MNDYAMFSIRLFAFLILTSFVHAAEFRGAWVASVFNLDWPSKPGLSAGEQKAQLRALLDRAADLKLNAILLQVRPASDALYASNIWDCSLGIDAGKKTKRKEG